MILTKLDWKQAGLNKVQAPRKPPQGRMKEALEIAIKMGECCSESVGSAMGIKPENAYYHLNRLRLERWLRITKVKRPSGGYICTYYPIAEESVCI